jgi:protein TonB
MPPPEAAHTRDFGVARRIDAGAERSTWTSAIGVALALEATLLTALLWWAQHHRPAPPPAPLDFGLQAPAAPMPAAPAAPPMPAPTSPRPAPHHHRVIPRPVASPPQPAPAPHPVPLPAHAPDVAPALPTPPAPVPSAVTPGSIRTAFEAQLRAAVQAAVRYPASARMMHLTGKALVAFTYQDGMASQVLLIRSSGAGELDQAALAAVHAARYPMAPQALAGQSLRFQVWVRFYLNDDDE